MLSLIVCVSFFLPKSHLGNVLVDMKLIDIKDTLPVGFIPIQETVDTRESSLTCSRHESSSCRKHFRCFLCAFFFGNI